MRSASRALHPFLLSAATSSAYAGSLAPVARPSPGVAVRPLVSLNYFHFDKKQVGRRIKDPAGVDKFLREVQEWLTVNSDWDSETRLVQLNQNTLRQALVWPVCYSLPVVGKPRVIILFNGADGGTATIFDAGLHGSSYERSCTTMQSQLHANKGAGMRHHVELYKAAGHNLSALLPQPK